MLCCMQTGSLDSEITRLLVTTKQMLQGLEAWAVGNLDEDGVSARGWLYVM